jgi:hypothetical protein
MTNEENQTELERVLSALLSLILEFSHYVTGSEDENEEAAMTHARQLYEEITGKEI